MAWMIRIILLIVAAMSSARADDFRAYDIEIVYPWARASAPGATEAAVFMKLSNTGDFADRLVRASSPVAGQVQLSTLAGGGDIGPSQPVRAIEIPPGEVVMLQPGGLHVLLSGVTQPLVRGTVVPLTLVFQRGGTIEITAEVTAMEALGPPTE
jgi:copper(I)-binding protein